MIENNRPLKPLVINKDFMKAKAPVGIIERDFFCSLPRDRYDLTVYCSDERPQVDCKFAHIIRVKDVNILKLIPGIAVRMGFSDLYNVPDRSAYSWAWKVRNEIRKNLRTYNFDYIHSISFPNTCHTIALQLKKKTGLPWIAQFYDPWVGSAFLGFKTKFFKDRYEDLERQVAENADFIIHDNDLIVEDWVRRYGENIRKKIAVLPIVFDPSKIIKSHLARKKNEDFLVLSHIGNLYKGRNSFCFIQALSMLLQRHSDFSNKLKVNYIGKVGQDERDMIANCGLTDIINCVGFLLQEECIPYYESTDIFMSIDSGDAGGELCFPSKILKYFYFQKPILGITPEQSVLTNELNKSGHIAIKNDDVEGIVAYLERAMADYDSLMNFNKDYYKRFLPEMVVEKYNEIVDGLIG